MDEYKLFISDLKTNFKNSQIKAFIKVNSELLQFYWYLGHRIIEAQKKYEWGSKFLENLSTDLSKEFPEVKGFSYRNLKNIRQWVTFWSEHQIGKQVVSLLFELPWGHHIAIIQKCKNLDEALYYLQNSVKNGISRSVLIHQIESNLYEREGKSINNFDETLPPIQSDLAKQITKDSYIFDFLSLADKHKEKELEDGLINNIKDFLLELGDGFAFVGKQYKLNIGGDEFRIDLLFYHIKLHCYVVIELKTTEFKPEYSGKLNFYVSAIDGEVKGKDDNPTIGILVCKSKNDIVVEYSLKETNNPMAVTEYFTNELPKKFTNYLTKEKK